MPTLKKLHEMHPSFLGLCTQNDNAWRNAEYRVPATTSRRHRTASDDHGGSETGSRPTHLADEEVEAQSGWESCPRPVRGGASCRLRLSGGSHGAVGVTSSEACGS